MKSLLHRAVKYYTIQLVQFTDYTCVSHSSCHILAAFLPPPAFEYLNIEMSANGRLLFEYWPLFEYLNIEISAWANERQGKGQGQSIAFHLNI